MIYDFIYIVNNYNVTHVYDGNGYIENLNIEANNHKFITIHNSKLENFKSSEEIFQCKTCKIYLRIYIVDDITVASLFSNLGTTIITGFFNPKKDNINCNNITMQRALM